MVEMSLNEASRRLDSNLTAVSSFLTDGVLDGMSARQADSHYRNDIEGIRSALHGNFDQAAGILTAEADYIRRNPAVRTQETNGVVAMATTMCAISLLKLGQPQDAERILRQEQQLDSTHWNKDKITKELNANALRVALLQQGKYGEVELSSQADKIATEVPGKAVPKSHAAEVGAQLLAEIDKAKKSPRLNLDEAMQVTERKLRQATEKMAELEQAMRQNPNSAQMENLRQEYNRYRNARDVQEVWKLEVEGMKYAFAGDFRNAELKLKAAQNTVDQWDDFRKVYPELTQSASSLYAYTLLVISKYEDAEKRFRKEIERDNTGGNTRDSEFKRLNQLGLKFALLRQGKYAEVAKATNVQVGQIGSAPAPRAVVFK